MKNFWILLVLISCTTWSNKSVQEKKSRIERVNALPYRSMNISKQLKFKIDSISMNVWNSIEEVGSDEFKLLKSSTEDSLITVDDSVQDLVSARNYSYDLWRDKDFEFTILIYRSYVRDIESKEERPVNVFEIEHEDLTGTYYLFFPAKKDFDIENLKSNYVDRN